MGGAGRKSVSSISIHFYCGESINLALCLRVGHMLAVPRLPASLGEALVEIVVIRFIVGLSREQGA